MLIIFIVIVIDRSRVSEEIVEEKKPLALAPISLTLRNSLQPDITALDLTFKPSQGVVATLELPLNLPLNFVAGKNLFRFMTAGYR